MRWTAVCSCMGNAASACFKKHAGLIFIIICIVSYTILFTLLAILRYHSFFSYEWEDQAVHHQLVWNTAQGNWFYTSIGVSGNYFSYHFQPIIFAQSLLYRLCPHIYTFFLMISAALGISALPLYSLAKRMFKNSFPAFLIAVSYLLYTPLHNINFCDGDPIIFVIPLLFFLLLTAESRAEWVGKNVLFGCLIVLILMCKEDLVFTVLFLGFYFLMQRKKKIGFFCIFSALLWFCISMPILIWLRYTDSMSLARSLKYNDFPELFDYLLRHPLSFFAQIVSPDHMQYLFQLFMPLAFLPFFSLISFAGIPALGEILLTKGSISYCQVYCIAPLIPFLFAGLVQTIQKIADSVKGVNSPQKITITLALIIAALNIINLTGNNILGRVREEKKIYDTRFMRVTNIFNPVFYRVDDHDKHAWRCILLIPQAASVAVSGDLLPAVSGRHEVRELFCAKYDYLDADYVLFHTEYSGFGAGDYCTMQQDDRDCLIARMRSSALWTLISEDNCFVLFKRNTR